MTKEEINHKRYPRVNSWTPKLEKSGNSYAHFVKGCITEDRRAVLDKWCYCINGEHK